MLQTHYSSDTGYLHEDKNLLPDLIDPARYNYREYREGLARWRKKYPQLTGLKEVVDVLDNVEARNAWAGNRTLFQDGKPVEVSSSELAVPEGADIKEFINAAKKYHDQLKFESENGNPVFVEKQEKPVRFSRRGWQKNVFGGASRKKRMLFPKLREIMSTAKWKYTNNVTDKPGFTKAHWYENQVILDGENLTVGFTLLEDRTGNLFYNIADDITKSSKGKLSNGLPVTQRQGPEELSQDGLSPDKQNIQDSNDHVNLEITKTPLRQSKRGYRGHIADLSGQITRYDPNLGKFFSYKKGEELFQDKLLRQKFDALAPIMVKGDEIFNEENPFPEKMAARRNRIIEWLAEKGLFKSYHNKDKEWDIIVSRGSIRSTASHGLDLGKAQILAVLPEMLEKAIYIGKGRKNSRDIFTAKVQLGDEQYVTGIVIDTDKAGHRFLNYELSEIEKLDSVSLDRAAKTAVTEQNQARSVLSIVQDKLGVKDNENIILLQDKENRRGSVALYSDTYLVNLFDDADLSTLVHESGHIFFEELKKIVDNGMADEALASDYNILRNWLGALDGEELTIEQREKAARGFEAYLMEGKAPSRELKSAFSRFRKWLTAIYRKALNLNVELTDEVRGVFDRMLASEAEINGAAQKSGLGGLTRKELERLGLNPDGVTSAEQYLRRAQHGKRRQYPEIAGGAQLDGRTDCCCCETLDGQGLEFCAINLELF